MDEFISAVKTFYNKYADFEGTATRPEFWYVLLYIALFSFLFGILMEASFVFSVIFGIWILANIIPGWSVAVRRLHDTDRSGWYVLIGLIPFFGWIISFIMMAQKGRPNRWASNSNLVNPVPDINVQTPQAERPRPNTPDDTDLSSGKTKFR